MTKHLLAAILVAAACGTLAQTRPAPPAPPFAGTAFDLEQASVPRAYRGHDATAIAAALAKRPKKGEYETTTEHEAKVAKWEESPLYAKVKPRDQLAFRTPFITFERTYDADTETFKLSFDRRQHSSAEDYSRPMISLRYLSKDLPPASGQTAMGIRFQYTRRVATDFGVKLNNIELGAASFEFKVPRDVARSSAQWAILVIGELSDPYEFAEERYHNPSLTERYETMLGSRGLVIEAKHLWVFNPIDGAVLAKLPVQ